MKGFPLAGLLRLRALQEEQAAAELALANADRRRAERRRRETAEALAGMRLPESADDLTWQAAVAARAAMRSLTTEAGAAQDVAAERAGHAGAAWSAARTRAVALGKLEERHGRAVRAEEERAEQLVLDEAAARVRRSDPTDPHRPTEGDVR